MSCRRSGAGGWGIAGALALGLLVAAAHAEPPKEAAKRHSRNGLTHFTLDHFDDAIKEFELAYAAVPDPTYLYQIGQCYKGAKRPRDAVAYYQRYLRAAPNAPNRAEVQSQIVQLQQMPTQTLASNGPPVAQTHAAVVPTTSTPTNQSVPSTPAPVEKPKNVRSEELDAQAISKPDPHLPQAVKQRLQSGDVTFSAKVCIDKQGKVFYTQVLQSIPGADEDLLSTIKRWTYRPMPNPVCFVGNWVFGID